MSHLSSKFNTSGSQLQRCRRLCTWPLLHLFPITRILDWSWWPWFPLYCGCLHSTPLLAHLHVQLWAPNEWEKSHTLPVILVSIPGRISEAFPTCLPKSSKNPERTTETKEQNTYLTKIRQGISTEDYNDHKLRCLDFSIKTIKARMICFHWSPEMPLQ